MVRTLYNEICWILPKKRKYPLLCNLKKFYNHHYGYFFSNGIQPEYDGEQVNLELCTIIYKCYYMYNDNMDQDCRVLAPYALCANDYEGCSFCNKYKDTIKINDCPYSLTMYEQMYAKMDRTIAIYKLYPRIDKQILRSSSYRK